MLWNLAHGSVIVFGYPGGYILILSLPIGQESMICKWWLLSPEWSRQGVRWLEWAGTPRGIQMMSDNYATLSGLVLGIFHCLSPNIWMVLELPECGVLSWWLCPWNTWLYRSNPVYRFLWYVHKMLGNVLPIIYRCEPPSQKSKFLVFNPTSLCRD